MPTPHKGTRLRLNLRVAPATYTAVAQNAKAAGLTINDYCAMILALATNTVESERRPT
jgi:predicted HicB family RNase H-like nuclease